MLSPTFIDRLLIVIFRWNIISSEAEWNTLALSIEWFFLFFFHIRFRSHNKYRFYIFHHYAFEHNFFYIYFQLSSGQILISKRISIRFFIFIFLTYRRFFCFYYYSQRVFLTIYIYARRCHTQWRACPWILIFLHINFIIFFIIILTQVVRNNYCNSRCNNLVMIL